MSGLFSKPKVQEAPTPSAPTPAPTIDVARQSQQSQYSAAARRGRAATILTSTSGDLSQVKTGAKRLMGE